MNNITNIAGGIPDGFYAVKIKEVEPGNDPSDLEKGKALKVGESLSLLTNVTFVVLKLNREVTKSYRVLKLIRLPDMEFKPEPGDDLVKLKMLSDIVHYRYGVEVETNEDLIGREFGVEVKDGEFVELILITY